MEIVRADLMTLFRIQQRTKALTIRGAHWVCCDICGEQKPVDYHEIFSRSYTISGSEARRLSYQEELCACLCRECHQQAETRDTMIRLLQGNIKRYTQSRVLAAYDKLQAAMRTPLPLKIEEFANG